MDFASLISKEIAKKKQLAVQPNDKATENESTSKPAFTRRSDIVQSKREQYLQEQAKLEEERKLKLEKQRREREEEESRREEKRLRAETLYQEKKRKLQEEEQDRDKAEKKQKTKGRPSITPEPVRDETPVSENDQKEDLTSEQIVERLRKYGEPIRRFGESDEERLRRLRRIERRNVCIEVELYSYVSLCSLNFFHFRRRSRKITWKTNWQMSIII